MNKLPFILLFFLLSLTGKLVVAQSDAIVNPPEYIKSIVLQSAQTNNYTPIVQLGSSLVVEFDDLEGDQKQYSYKIEHYDYNWKRSNLNITEYVDGFSSDWIRDFENSFNTIQGYTHYKFTLPNDNIRIKISGNYMLSILNEDDEVIFTRPFIVYQPLVNIGVSVHRSRDIATINTKQNVQFTINHPDLLINNPSVELKIAVYQNMDWHTLKKDIQPQFTRGTQLLYKYGARIDFWGGNEFLFFDTKQIRNATNNVYRSELKDTFNTYLYTTEIRANKPYTNLPDINGNFVIRTIDNEDIALEADYSWVHFTLESDKIEEPVYIYGDFNDWQLTDDNKMTFDAKNNVYSGKLLLKQGFYNYNYVTVKNNTVNNHKIAGSFYQTENEYTVLAYYRPIGSRYDQVIGVGSTNSQNLRN